LKAENSSIQEAEQKKIGSAADAQDAIFSATYTAQM